jgi:sulfate adenylyltransferase
MTGFSTVPHGGRLVRLVADPDRAAELKAASRDWLSWDVTPRQLCDLELLLNGGFSPLTGFMVRADFDSVCARMRLADGTLWPIPITLDVTEAIAGRLSPGATLALRDPEGVMLAALHVAEIWQSDREAEALAVYGSADRAHPGVARLLDRTHPVYVGGTVEGLQLPLHYDFRSLRLTPEEVRAELAQAGWKRTLAVHAHEAMHRAEHEATWRAARGEQASVLLHTRVGLSNAGDAEHYTRVRCHVAAAAQFPPGAAKHALLPLAARSAGARDAVLDAIVAKNYGCSHLLVGGPDETPEAVTRAALDLLREHEAELHVGAVSWASAVNGGPARRLFPSELHRLLVTNQPVPDWFTFDEVAQTLRGAVPPRERQGFTIFFTGLPSSGKSTIANVLRVKLLELGSRRDVTLLDGDLVRKHLSSELGFSREHRDLNIRRIAFVASEITRHGGVAICAPIAPYAATRKEARSMIEPHGGFVLVCVSTPLDICEQRDRKGLYAKARAGIVREFTGVSDPYEVPDDAELAIDTSKLSAEEAAHVILQYLQKEGYLAAGA